MDKGVLSFNKIDPSVSNVEKVWAFDPSDLEVTDGVTISKYSMYLSMYLVFLKSQQNQTKAVLMKKKHFVDDTVRIMLTEELKKKHKTKTEAVDYIKWTSSEVATVEAEIKTLKEELQLIEGIDKTVYELIATFKRELTRREKELDAIRLGRKTL